MRFTIIPEFKVKEDKIEEFKVVIRQHAHNSYTKEEGCLGFDCAQDKEDPTRFFLWETYVDEAALDIHRESDHFAWYTEMATPLVEPGPDGRLPQSIVRCDLIVAGRDDGSA